MKTLARWLLVLMVAAPLAAQAARAEGDAHFTDAELDRLLAPVALYPDTVLSQVLVASTYPLEVVQAARWSREHPDLRGEAAVDAVAHMDWDASVRALVAFPELLARMDSDLDWTQDLGDAFLGNQAEVMDRVQFLRERASESGHLDEVEHERVVREREVIYIEPEVADVVYLPFYDPFVVYGDWWWPAYPPYRWAYWAGHPAAYYAYYGTFYWGVGFRLAPAFYFCSFDWPSRQVVVINDVHNNYYYGHHYYSHDDGWHHDGDHDHDGSVWHHDPDHRRGVGYRDARLDDQWHHGYRRHDDDARRGPWLAAHADASGHGGSSWRGDGQGWQGQHGQGGAGHDSNGHEGNGHPGNGWGHGNDGGPAHGGTHSSQRQWQGRAYGDGSVTVDRPAYGRSGHGGDSSPREAGTFRGGMSPHDPPARARGWGDSATRAESYGRSQGSERRGAPMREAPAEARGQGRVGPSAGSGREGQAPPARRNPREWRGQAER